MNAIIEAYLKEQTGEDWTVTIDSHEHFDWMINCDCRGYPKRVAYHADRPEDLEKGLQEIVRVYKMHSESGEADVMRKIIAEVRANRAKK